MSEKKKSKEDSLFTKHYRVVVIPLVFLLYLFSHFILNPYEEYWYNFAKDTLAEDAVYFLIYCILITEVSLWLSRVLNRILPWNKFPSIRAMVQVLLLILIIYAFFFIINFIYYLITPIDPDDVFDIEDKVDLWQSLIISVNTGIFISAIHTGYFLITNWRQSMMDAADLKLRTEQLERIASQAELESLKMQLDPHFLFNNFSTLSELVIEDQKLAVTFIDNLSLVYRYMISNIRKDLILLKEEIRFVESYFYLIHERMGSKVKLKINIASEIANFYYIAPISLQLLVENAIKHNRASKEFPLVITIDIVDNFVVVCNNIQALVVEIPSSKVGLSNIIERYKLLSTQKVAIQKTTDNFIVKLPLLEKLI